MAQVLNFTDMVLTTIKPVQKTAHVDTIDPTSLDWFTADVFTPVFFAYRLEDKTETVYLQFSKRIKESLQKVLVPFFSFAGRWIASPAGSANRQLLCNDAGVPFVEAYVDKDLDAIVHASAAFQPVPELQGFGSVGMDATLMRQKMQPDGLPCIFVQVTRFKCGGVVVAVTYNHMHSDGTGFVNFMTAWSDLSRTNETTVKVDHNRALADNASFKKVLSRHQAPPTITANQGGGDPAKVELWPMKYFEVSAFAIKSLKQEAKLGAKGRTRGAGFVSSGDCIIAHLWKSLARLPSSILGGKEVGIAITVEGRSRFYDPPLPDLCGNVYASMVGPKIPPTELQEMPVASIASKLRDKLHTTTRDEWLAEERLQEEFVMPRLWRCTSWIGFPMYELDFGFGKPYFASGVNYNVAFPAIGIVCICPPLPSSSSSIASVSLWSTREILEALECDPAFLLLFLPRGTRNLSSVSEDQS